MTTPKPLHATTVARRLLLDIGVLRHEDLSLSISDGTSVRWRHRPAQTSHLNLSM